MLNNLVNDNKGALEIFFNGMLPIFLKKKKSGKSKDYLSKVKGIK